jgi:hypothetical protein
VLAILPVNWSLRLLIVPDSEEVGTLSSTIVISLPFNDVVIPDPPKIVKPAPKGTTVDVELSSLIVTVELESLAFAMNHLIEHL